MPPRKDKNKMIEGIESSAAASKRRRIDILNGTTGVPFTNPFTQFPSTLNSTNGGTHFTNTFTQFPSMHFLQQNRYLTQNADANVTDLHLAPPTPYDQVVRRFDDGLMSSLLLQQNFVINYHVNQMLQNMDQFWQRNLSDEMKKRVEMERKLKEKEEKTELFKQMYHYYEQRAFHLEQTLQRRSNGEGCSTVIPAVALEEQVESCMLDLNSEQRMDMMCKGCRNRPATMLWLPCRHLCVCMACERVVDICPICNAKKTESFKINLP